MNEAQELLARISKSRGNTDSSNEQTEVSEAVEVEQNPVKTEETEVIKSTEVKEGKAEESEVVIEDGEQKSTEEDLYVEYKGREINLKDVEEWEQGHLRQSDYTRKTQELSSERKEISDERKLLEVEKAKFSKLQSSFTENSNILEAMIKEDEISDDALKEMREFEPDEYIKRQEKIAARKKLLAEVKQTVATNEIEVDYVAENKKLFDANPSWMDNGKQTKAFVSDMDLIQTYATDAGYSNDELKATVHAHHFQTLLDAAKYQKAKVSNAAIVKKVRLAPVTTKPRATVNNSEIEAARKVFKENPNDINAVALRKLQRKSK